jgi:hypothetical protein
MPCYDSRSSPSYVRKEAREEFKKDLDNLTKWLCGILGVLEQSPVPFKIQDPELAEWWEEHKKLDEKRKEKKK